MKRAIVAALVAATALTATPAMAAEPGTVSSCDKLRESFANNTVKYDNEVDFGNALRNKFVKDLGKNAFGELTADEKNLVNTRVQTYIAAARKCEIFPAEQAQGSASGSSSLFGSS